MAFVISIHPQRVQVGEGFRIDLSKIFVNSHESPIASIEISLDGGETYLTVAGQELRNLNDKESWHIDWLSENDGNLEINVKVTLEDGTEVLKQSSIEVVTSESERLLSSDDDLRRHESEIMSWLPEGKTNFNYAHREAQRMILDFLFDRGYVNESGKKISANDIYNSEDFRGWSKYQALALIMADIKKSPEDIFSLRQEEYQRLVESSKNKAKLRFKSKTDKTPLSFSMTEVTMRRR